MPRILRLILGSLLVLVGIAGLFLPILQGLLFLALGFFLLAPDVPLFRRFLDWIESRFPKLRGSIQKWRTRFIPRKARAKLSTPEAEAAKKNPSK